MPAAPAPSRRELLAALLVTGATGALSCGRGEAPALGRTLGGPGRSDGRFVTPRGISAAGDGLWVVDRSGRVQLIGFDGRPLLAERVVEGEVGFPIGVLAGPDDGLLLCDTHTSRLRTFRREERAGELVETGEVGGLGDELGRFTYPQRAARAPDGALYVSEYGDGDSNRVQVFGPDLEPRFAFGGYGSTGARFVRPMGLVVVGDELFVCDVSDRIVVFGTDGSLRREIGVSGPGAGELRYPYGLCSDGAVLFVCEYGNHRLQRFTLEGETLGCYGGPGSGPGRFSGPWDLTLAPTGELFVCDTGNHRVVALDPSSVPWEGGAG